jgi:hypothetical protein
MMPRVRYANKHSLRLTSQRLCRIVVTSAPGAAGRSSLGGNLRTRRHLARGVLALRASRGLWRTM